MTDETRKGLDFGNLLEDRPGPAPAYDLAGIESRPERWPSREAPRESQINIRTDSQILDRFKRLCRDDRRTYGDMLRILIDAFESREGRGSGNP